MVSRTERNRRKNERRRTKRMAKQSRKPEETIVVDDPKLWWDQEKFDQLGEDERKVLTACRDLYYQRFPEEKPAE